MKFSKVIKALALLSGVIGMTLGQTCPGFADNPWPAPQDFSTVSIVTLCPMPDDEPTNTYEIVDNVMWTIVPSGTSETTILSTPPGIVEGTMDIFGSLILRLRKYDLGQSGPVEKAGVEIRVPEDQLESVFVGMPFSKVQLNGGFPKLETITCISNFVDLRAVLTTTNTVAVLMTGNNLKVKVLSSEAPITVAIAGNSNVLEANADINNGLLLPSGIVGSTNEALLVGSVQDGFSVVGNTNQVQLNGDDCNGVIRLGNLNTCTTTSETVSQDPLACTTDAEVRTCTSLECSYCINADAPIPDDIIFQGPGILTCPCGSRCAGELCTTENFIANPLCSDLNSDITVNNNLYLNGGFTKTLGDDCILGCTAGCTCEMCTEVDTQPPRTTAILPTDETTTNSPTGDTTATATTTAATNPPVGEVTTTPPTDEETSLTTTGSSAPIAYYFAAGVTMTILSLILF